MPNRESSIDQVLDTLLARQLPTADVTGRVIDACAAADDFLIDSLLRADPARAQLAAAVKPRLAAPSALLWFARAAAVAAGLAFGATLLAPTDPSDAPVASAPSPLPLGPDASTRQNFSLSLDVKAEGSESGTWKLVAR